MNIEMIEALVVEEDEILVLRVNDDAFSAREKLGEFSEALDNTPLKGRYIIFSGEVEFTKVKL